MKQIIVKVLIFLAAMPTFAQDTTRQTVVIFDLKKEIAPEATRITQQAIKKADDIDADLIIIHMNTYGGYVTDADSIRTRILNTDIPTYVFIDNNAASAGSLISIACDKIYMTKGANIGATTVVNEDGTKAPDKYQSYMRKQMRSTAESHGKDTIINNGDTTYTYYRNPDIAEGMVDERVVVEGLDDADKVITLTTEEALKWGYCEGQVSSIEEILEINNITNARRIYVEPTFIDKLVAFFANPALRSILILVMMGGIYFELQTPGVGFPLVASILAAVGYFAPLYIEGLAENWEILVFFIGVVLIIVEVFIIPGFGVAGVSGILLMLSGLVLTMVRNIHFDFEGIPTTEWNNALASVLFAMIGLGVVFYFFSTHLINSKFFQRIVLSDVIDAKVPIQGEQAASSAAIGSTGTTHTALRPMGKIRINGTTFEAKTYGEMIDQGAEIKVLSIENGYLIVSTLEQ
ncbi:MAG: nodulation protein NfeD [Bacteroidetes bacterium]|mgnify:CR=1 FL=1|jgi:membrane-bound serine protease (ClpP class)|nr:nodulation protein NfeD [Bacteroidota bacterium]